MRNDFKMACMQTGFTTVVVKFRDQDSRKSYTYKAKTAANVKAGDVVVVDSPKSGLVCVDVIEVHAAPRMNKDAQYAYKWIVCKVDQEAYDAQLEREAEFMSQMEVLEQAKIRSEVRAEALEAFGDDVETQAAFVLALRKLEGDVDETSEESD